MTKCSKCLKYFRLSKGYKGKTLTCPGCGSSLKVKGLIACGYPQDEAVFTFGPPDLERDFSGLPKYCKIYKNKIPYFRINETPNFWFATYKLIDDEYLLVVYVDYEKPGPYYLGYID